jgi:uncharacterized lipoprotein YajG
MFMPMVSDLLISVYVTILRHNIASKIEIIIVKIKYFLTLFP